MIYYQYGIATQMKLETNSAFTNSALTDIQPQFDSFSPNTSLSVLSDANSHRTRDFSIPRLSSHNPKAIHANWHMFRNMSLYTLEGRLIHVLCVKDYLTQPQTLIRTSDCTTDRNLTFVRCAAWYSHKSEVSVRCPISCAYSIFRLS